LHIIVMSNIKAEWWLYLSSKALCL